VPPVAVTVTVELPPLHKIAVTVAVAVNTDGSITVTVVVAVHPLVSVIVYVYVPAGSVNVPVPVYGAVPPDAVTVIVELPPLHKIAVAVAVVLNTDGSVTDMVVVTVHPLASVTMYVYVPAGSINVPVPLYGAVPPDAVTVIVELPPLHKIAVAVAVAVIIEGSVIVTVVVAVHPLASVTMYVYVPACSVNVPVPVYGDVPPVAVTVIVELSPLHKITVAVAVAVIIEGSVIVTVVVAVHPLASVTMYVYVPAGSVYVPVPVKGGVPPVAVTVIVELSP
jgi:hypothetical protein